MKTILLIAAISYASEWRTVDATWYCPCSICCGAHADGKTATGRDASKQGVAVDPRVIPLGSRLDIPGASWVLADDTGSAITGNRIDIRVQSHAEALRMGRKTMRVRVWRKIP